MVSGLAVTRTCLAMRLRESRATGDAVAGGPDGPWGTPQADPAGWPAPNPRTAAKPASPERIPPSADRGRHVGRTSRRRLPRA
jgi:hypothetical protein